MDERDIILLEYLAQFEKEISLSENDAPYSVRTNFTFIGTDKNKYPKSIHVKLFELGEFDLVEMVGIHQWKITKDGRIKLQELLQQKNQNKWATEKQLEKLSKEIIALDDKIKANKPSNYRANTAILISVLGVLLEVWIIWKRK